MYFYDVNKSGNTPLAPPPNDFELDPPSIYVNIYVYTVFIVNRYSFNTWHKEHN